jgi:hypothetical protein
VLSSDLGNREPGSFDRPDELEVTRSARHHLSFGYGVHQCLEAPLARIELQTVYATLFRRIPSLRLATDIASLSFREAAVVDGVAELPVTWDAASDSRSLPWAFTGSPRAVRRRAATPWSRPFACSRSIADVRRSRVPGNYFTRRFAMNRIWSRS